MRHLKTMTLVAALLALLASAALAQGVNYGKLWQGLTGPEKELLLIGYARGLKSAGCTMRAALGQESMEAGARSRLQERCESLPAGLETSEDVKAVVECLDTFYGNSANQFIDWTALVGVARLKLEDAGDDRVEDELARLRRSAQDLDEIMRRREGK
jgi:hypothetical protein